MSWETEQIRRNVHRITFDDVRGEWEQRILLRSDAHHDNVKNDWGLEKKHLQQAVDYDAPIIDVGDAFCLMQGKYDPRKDLNQLKEEHKRRDYLDAVVSTTANDYSPFADQFAIMGNGNHETSIIDRLGYNPTGNLVYRLNSVEGKKRRTYSAGYAGWVFLTFRIQKTRGLTFKLFYHHGMSAGGPVTRGVIDTNRMAVWLPDADIVVSGHSHDQWVVPIERFRVTNQGKNFKSTQWHVRAGTYKDDFGDGFEGWAVERGHPPKRLGAVWMILTMDNRAKSTTNPIKVSFQIGDN